MAVTGSDSQNSSSGCDRSENSADRLPGCGSCPYNPPALQPYAKSLHLCFLVCKMGLTIMPPLQAFVQITHVTFRIVAGT